jgi:hypothetical protein
MNEWQNSELKVAMIGDADNNVAAEDDKGAVCIAVGCGPCCGGKYSVMVVDMGDGLRIETSRTASVDLNVEGLKKLRGVLDRLIQNHEEPK